MPRVEIFTSPWCAFSLAAKRLLDRKGVPYEETDVTEDPALRDEMARRTGGDRRVPQVFIGGVHVGGCMELHALDSEGRLDALLGGAA